MIPTLTHLSTDILNANAKVVLSNLYVEQASYWPGPASSVVERSLRKISVRGDRGSIPAAG